MYGREKRLRTEISRQTNSNPVRKFIMGTEYSTPGIALIKTAVVDLGNVAERDDLLIPD